MAARAEVIASFQPYSLLASTHQLFSLTASDHGKGEQQVFAEVTKKELIDLYSRQMVGEGKPRRILSQPLVINPPAIFSS